MAPDAKETRQAEREAKRAEKERIRQEKTDAYIAKENEQAKLIATNEALAAPFSDTDTDDTGPDTDTDGPIPADVQRVIDANNAKIEKLERELEQIYNSTLGFVVGRSKKQRLEDMIAAASGAETVERAAPKDQIAELKIDTLALAAQHLIAAGLLPGDLKGGDPKRSQAARLVGREGASPAELSAFADELQPAYDIEMSIKKAAEDMEKGVIVGRTTDAIKEVVTNPAKMGGAALGLLGAWLLYSAVGSTPSDGAMKWIKGILGVAGLGVGIGVVSGALSYKNIGLGDAVEKLTGVRADEAFSTESMDKVRHLFDGMPTTDTDAVDDFIRIMDAPVENVADMFRAALKDGATEVEAARLLNNGLSSKERKFVDEGSLYTSCSWFFLKCYEQGLAKGDLATTTDEKTKLLLGLDWSKKNFKGHQMGTAVAAFEMVRLGSGTGTVETTGTTETGITNPALAKLEKDVPAFGEVLEKTPRADIYLIHGYPVRYNHTDEGHHIFTDVLDPTKPFTPVDAVLTGDALEVTLRGISTEAGSRARAALASKYPALGGRFKYARNHPKGNPQGYFELDPKEDRLKHIGLPHYKEEKKVELVFYFDVDLKVTRLGLDTDQDGVVDPLPGDRNTPYTSISEVKEDFEKPLLHERVEADINKTLLVPFRMSSTSAKDVGNTTEVYIEYGTAKGTVVYENDKIKSYVLGSSTLGSDDAELDAKWTSVATERCKSEKLLGDPRVQAALLRGTTNYTEYNPGTIGGLVDKFTGLAKEGINWFTNDSLANKFANAWEKEIVRRMTALIYDPVNGLAAKYVKDVFKKHPSNADFQRIEDAFFNAQVTDIEGTGVVMATVTRLDKPNFTLKPGEAMEMVNNTDPKEGGTGRLRAALEPLKSQVPANMPGLFNSAYQSMKNLFTDDAARTEWFKQAVSAAVIDLATAVNRLPAPVTRDAVTAEIDRAVALAQTKALNYHGLNNQDAVKKLLVAPADGGDPDWIKASEKVASYVSNNMKWEKYAFIPNPENMAAIMQLWYDRLGDPKIPPTIHPPLLASEEADQYADYFIWELQTRMGGKQDYSPEYFYGDVQSVSDTNYKGMITSLSSAVQPYSVWTKSPELRPPTPDMLPAIELHRENLKVRFNTWFDKYADCGGLFKLDHYWPQVFEGNVRDRFAQIINDPSATVATLDRDVKDFTQWVWVERYMVMEPLMLNRVEAERKGFDIRVRIFNKFPQFFYPAANRTTSYPRYVMIVKSQMQDIMSSHHTFPNMPGVPLL